MVGSTTADAPPLDSVAIATTLADLEAAAKALTT
jgi:hypothetical protein